MIIYQVTANKTLLKGFGYYVSWQPTYEAAKAEAERWPRHWQKKHGADEIATAHFRANIKIRKLNIDVRKPQLLGFLNLHTEETPAS